MEIKVKHIDSCVDKNNSYGIEYFDNDWFAEKTFLTQWKIIHFILNIKSSEVHLHYENLAQLFGEGFYHKNIQHKTITFATRKEANKFLDKLKSYIIVVKLNEI